MKKLFILTFCLVLGFEFVNCLECNIFDSRHSHVFFTKTNYNESFAYFNSKSAFLDLSFVPETCELDKIYFLLRHSTRNPSKSVIKYLSELYPKSVKNLNENLLNDLNSSCSHLHHQLSKWVFRYKITEANLVTNIGEEITKEIGQRFAQAFGQLLYNSYAKLGISNEIRTLQTLKAFLRGFEKPLIGQEIQVRQSMFFHELGQGDKVKKDKEFGGLIKKYKESPEIQELQESISKRLNLENPLNLDEIKMIYQLCSFDYNLFNDPFWCNFFKDKELDRIEFLLDASLYLKFHSNNVEPSIKNSAIFFKELRDFLISPQEKVFLGFTHSHVLKAILARLKLFENKIYLTENFEESFMKSSEREWRGSRILPFNSNIAFVKYNCPDPVNNHNISKVLTLFQEEPIVIGNCEGLMCPIDKFLGYINPLHTNV